MAKRIIILEKREASVVAYDYLMWAAVPAARQPFYAKVGVVSAWSGASAAENTAIALGQVAERRATWSRAEPRTLAAIRAELEVSWTAFQAEINAVNPWDRHGSFWDDLGGWTAGGVS